MNTNEINQMVDSVTGPLFEPDIPDVLQGPRFEVAANQDPSGQRIHEVSPSWLVCIVPFNEPVSSFNADISEAIRTKPPLVIENDAIAVSVNRPKASFGKTASVTLKVSNTYYQNACASGDWIVIWMSDWQDDIDRIARILRGTEKGSLNDWQSGLKFVGRILEIGAVDSVSMNGVRVQTQTINAQMFLEMASSLYYTYLQQSVTLDSATPSGTKSQTAQILNKQTFDQQNLDSALGSMYKNLVPLFQIGNQVKSDDIIANLIILTMGVSNKDNKANITGGLGTPNDAIMVPKLISTILGRPSKQYLWEMYSVYVGLQKYSTRSGAIWEQFMPDCDPARTNSKDRDTVFWWSPTRLKGTTVYRPPAWNNNSIWSVLNQYQNNLLDEMYTCLRCNGANQIVPTVVIREQPWSTGLFNYLQNGRSMDQIQTKAVSTENTKKQAQANKSVETKQSPDVRGHLNRTFFHNVPRWKIHESYVYGVNTSASESNRVNFVQVWSNAAGFSSLGGNFNVTEQYKASQIVNNFVIDSLDIRRNGLRSVILESNFDGVEAGGENRGDTPMALSNLSSPYWAKMKADWLFNGHLKLNGSISCQGIKWPICEGDNVDVRGVVYHIESLQHTGTITNGIKSFRTTLSVSNGLLAEGLTTNKAPLYSVHMSSSPRYFDSGPAMTQMQSRS